MFYFVVGRAFMVVVNKGECFFGLAAFVLVF